MARLAHSAAVLSGKIYVVGGMWEDMRCTAAVECYDPRADKWTRMAPMNIARAAQGCCVINNILYVVGGDSHLGNLALIERYDEIANNWNLVTRLTKNL